MSPPIHSGVNSFAPTPTSSPASSEAQRDAIIEQQIHQLNQQIQLLTAVVKQQQQLLSDQKNLNTALFLSVRQLQNNNNVHAGAIIQLQNQMSTVWQNHSASQKKQSRK